MPHPLSGHLWNAAILLASAVVALAADRLTASPKRPSSGTLDASAFGEIAGFVVPLRLDPELPRYHMTVWNDPFGHLGAVAPEPSVASAASIPTLSPSGGNHALTAILILDERRVAVIDETTVSVGDVLRDGARISAIQSDRVWVVEKSGRWRMIPLSNRSSR